MLCCMATKPQERPDFQEVMSRLNRIALDGTRSPYGACPCSPHRVDELPEAMSKFLASKGSWQQEIDAINLSYRQLEQVRSCQGLAICHHLPTVQDHTRLADKSAELEHREKVLRQREQALETQLHSMSLHSSALQSVHQWPLGCMHLPLLGGTSVSTREP